MGLSDFAILVEEWAGRWLLTAAGRGYWTAFAWDCMRYAVEEPERFPPGRVRPGPPLPSCSAVS